MGGVVSFYNTSIFGGLLEKFKETKSVGWVVVSFDEDITTSVSAFCICYIFFFVCCNFVDVLSRVCHNISKIRFHSLRLS